LRITCYPVGGGLTERRNARVRNVSKTGIGLVLDRHWQPGTALVLELPLAEGIRLTRGRVVHAASRPGGCFLVGCMFDQQLADDEVQALAR
jgi:PilZ domain-containing protein